MLGRRTALGLTCVLATGAGKPALAQDANRPLRLVVGTPPGAAHDTIARLIAERLREGEDQPILVENRPGAAGRIAVEAVRNAAPDGRTLLITPSANMVAQPLSHANLPYDPFRHFAPVSLLAHFQMVLAVAPAVGARDLAGYLAMARAEERLRSFASPASGSLLHFLGVLVGQATGIPFEHVPYNGTAQVLPALIGGHVPAAYLLLSDAVQVHREGVARILAASGEERSPVLPDVPTFRQGGLPIAGTGWFAAFAPRQTPQAVVERMSRRMAEAMRHPDVVARLTPLGLEVVGSSSAELAETHRRDFEAWAPVIRASGFRGDG